LAWTSFPGTFGSVIVGLQSGVIQIYDVEQMMNQASTPVQFEEQLFDDKVSSIEVNPFKSHLIAVSG
jgi:hypothetical protein